MEDGKLTASPGEKKKRREVCAKGCERQREERMRERRDEGDSGENERERERVRRNASCF